MTTNEIPIISITQDDSSPNLEDDAEDNRNYDINDAHTDIEDLDSDDNQKDNRSPSRMLKIRRKTVHKKIEDNATDIEDYNDSDSDLDEKPELEDIKLDLTEFLDQGFVEETSSNSTSRTGQMKQIRNTFKSLLNKPIEDDGGITDCEDLETSDEETEKIITVDEKPFDQILKDMLNDDGNNVSIQDCNNLNTRSSARAISPSILTDLSDSDSDGNRKYRSNVESIVFSDDGSSRSPKQDISSNNALDAEEIMFEASDNECSTPHQDTTYREVNISFASNDRTRVIKRLSRNQRPTKVSGNTLAIEKNSGDILTDVENLESSDDECNNSKDHLVIPIAVIHPNSIDAALTDVEDFDIDDDCMPMCSADIKLPSPVREITLMTEDAQGDPITKVMPLNSSGTFLGVIESYIDKGLTDTEDLSGNEDDYINTKCDSIEVPIPDVDGGIVENVESLSSRARNACWELSNVEPLTDVEELCMGDKSVRRRKPKPKSSKGKQLLEVDGANTDRGATDVEDLYVSDDQAKFYHCVHATATIAVPLNYDGGITDTEDVSGDEEELHGQPDDIDINALKQEAYFSTVTSSDGTVQEKFMNNMVEKKAPTELSADTEYLQFNSDIEDLVNADAYSRADTITPIEIRNALDETSSSSVYDHADNLCDRSNERAHIKGYRDILEAHTDVEYLEDDVQNKCNINNDQLTLSTYSFEFTVKLNM